MLMKKIILVITLMCLYIGGVCGQSSEVKGPKVCDANIENESSVNQVNSITYTALYNTIDLDPGELVGTLTLGSEIGGATSFNWGGLFPTQFKGSRTAPIVNVSKKHIIQMGGMYVWVDASNASETVRIIYNVTVGGEGAPNPFE